MSRMKHVKTPKILKPGDKPDRHSWPRNTVKSVECRKRDLVLRITDWLDDKDEPAYDVEVYIHGVYDWNESESFTTINAGPPRSPEDAKRLAIEFATRQIAKHL